RRELRGVGADAVGQIGADAGHVAHRHDGGAGHDPRDGARRRARSQGGTRLHLPGRAGRHGGEEAGQADVAPRGRFHPRPVPPDGAGAGARRPEQVRPGAGVDIPQCVAVDPRPARRDAARHRGQPGLRSLSGAAV
ncbi:hypothetical protein OSTOST_05732, partial [Ostertagia ostertagi]